MSIKPPMTFEEAQAAAAQKTAPRVTKEAIEAKIAKVEYLVHGELMTVCFITLKNGFMVHGVSAPASPENFDSQVGKGYAYHNAFQQLWPLEGYLLREKLGGTAFLMAHALAASASTFAEYEQIHLANGSYSSKVEKARRNGQMAAMCRAALRAAGYWQHEDGTWALAPQREGGAA